MGEGLDLGLGPRPVDVDLGVFPLRQRRDGAEVEAAADLPRDLGRAQDRRPVGHVDEAGLGNAALRRAPDPPAVEELRVGPAVGLVDVEAAFAEVEDARALDEEGPLFRVVGLLVADVDDGRVDLDLAEVGVDRGVEGQVALQAGLEVEAGVPAEVAPGPERVPGFLRARLGPARGIGGGLDPAAAVDVPDADEVGEARDQAALLLGLPGIPVGLLFPHDDALEIDGPEVSAALREPELVERDAHLERPAFAVDAGGAFPDAVPRRVHELVVIERPVHDRAGRIDGEEVAAPPVVIRVDPEVEPVRIDLVVAASEQPDDAVRPRIAAAGGDVEVLAVVGDPDGRRLGRGRAVRRVRLDEAAGSRRLPDVFRQPAVDLDGRGRADGGDRPAGGGPRAGRGQGRREDKAGGGEGGAASGVFHEVRFYPFASAMSTGRAGREGRSAAGGGPCCCQEPRAPL